MRQVIALAKAFVLKPTAGESEDTQEGREAEFYLTTRRTLTEEAARCAITIIRVGGFLSLFAPAHVTQTQVGQET
jgi:hypothetical protein